ncbi:Gfo/Idh/MocA family protein [Cohnella silvisoli]|uniref:Gfo/Idh/MocA family oxidoreductase n=1 Tax=Cohnella silvisoli TaxID=2873699 RepID=A0ABV1KYT9_9BACL|nr:Gfo/Idh/MocA family oxidoreductase [Cohnella silvisoli]MCD9021869.1 Gfo/Idh/MocA family oxidoreductase [Cohnella silvisoli]
MNLGVIGYGLRMRTVIGEIMKLDPSCQVTAVVDLNNNAISARMREQGTEDIRFYTSTEEMLDAERLDGVLVGTRCSLHTEMALKIMPRGIPLFLEKPVSTNMEDLLRLKRAYDDLHSPVVVSFPLRMTTIVKSVKEIVDSGKIGTVEHVQAVNNVPYGSVYFQSWYRDESITGGLFLQKATHDFDYINHVLQYKPIEVCAMTSKQVFKGTKPAELKCKDCEEKHTCADSKAFKTGEEGDWEYCCFAEDTGNEDSGSAIIRYESGMHVSYSHNFFARREAGRRGARFLGYKGTVEFDFIKGKIMVMMHHTPRVETYEFEAGKGHYGGDAALAENFVRMMKNGASSQSSLEDGLTSALMCLKARESAISRQFQAIGWDF